MVVPDLVFDVILFGVLLLAVVADSAFPQQLHGAASLLAIGSATYLAAQEMCDDMGRRKWWTQDSLATALALATAGFIYYWWRNDSDIALLGLSIGLMMAALMVMISVIAAASATIAQKSVQPMAGLIATTLGALALGVLSGLLIFVLTSNAPMLIKALTLGVGIVLWKLREILRPPAQNEMEMAVPTAATAHPGGRWALMPQRGTLLDRFLPVLVLGAVLFITLQRAIGFTFK